MTTPDTARSTPALFTGVVCLSLLAALIPTFWPGLDLQAASLFSGSQAPLGALGWWWIQPINDYVPAIFRVLLLLALVAALLTLRWPRWAGWRRPLTYFFVAGVLIPGALVNWGFKDNWQRARPYQVQNFGGTQQFTRAAVMTDQCDANCAFVSGHVACGVFLASLGLVHRRRMRHWTALGVFGGLFIGFARMADMAHWMSDVLWAFPITLGGSWVVWKVLTRFYRSP